MVDKGRTENDGEAQLRLAELYESGELWPQDCKAASYWYGRAASASGFHGPYGTGLALYVGSNCMPRDVALARKHFEVAAASGHVVSKVAIAKILRSGKFGPMRALVGYLKVVPIAVEAMYLVAAGDPNDRLWDASRWLPRSRAMKRMRVGTRFE